jgi:hypothetical protein
VSQDNLGLFDTPPEPEADPVQHGQSSACCFVVLVLVLDGPDVPLGQIDSFIPMIDACTALVD